MRFNLKETEKAYIAGFFDADGHVSILKQKPKPPRWKNPTYQLRAVITNSNEAIIDGINLAFNDMGYKHGPYASNFKNGKPLFQLHFAGQKCKQFLQVLNPYLVIKKTQAEIGINYPLLKERTHKGKGLTKLELSERESLYQLMKKLNQKGVHND